MAERGRVARAIERVSGLAVREPDEVLQLEESDRERRALQRELDLLAYSALDYFGGSEQDLKAVERRKLVQQARVAWQRDPQLGGIVDLLNDFTFGRGIPAPKCADSKVQEVVDEAWEDPDNELVLTTHSAQVALGTDLLLQSNVFVLTFDEGDDGKVKLGLLSHDAVENVVRDPENRFRVLYYAARDRKVRWDFKADRPVVDVRTPSDRLPLIYYEHWRNPEDKREAKEAFDQPPDEKRGKGRVYHVAVNKTSEMAFGHPMMDRVIRWATAFNGLAEARVDIARATSALVMKRKVKGTKHQVEKMATKALARRSRLAAAADADRDTEVQAGPRAASVLTENEQIDTQPFKLDSMASNAETDGRMIRSQVAAATHIPPHYLGDIGQASLQAATALELPVMKTVERFQETFEQLFRWFVDKVIDRAIDAGRLDAQLSPEEYQEKRAQEEADRPKPPPPPTPPVPPPGGPPPPGTEPPAAATRATEAAEGNGASPNGDGGLPPNPYGPLALGGAPPEEPDEQEMERDLSYELSMPSPLRRQVTDVMSSIETVAQVFDPNGTNVELNRMLLGIALSELEVGDPAKGVDRVFPEGYEDPALGALAQLNAARGQQPPQPGEENPYGAPQQAAPPEQVAESAGGTLPSSARAAAIGRGDEAAERLGAALERAIRGRRARGR